MATVASMAMSESKSTKWRFVATIFCGSFLLFLVQPMIARMALPRLGGAPAVWNSAMLVYQALLLAGYAYAHWLGRLAPARQSAVHLLAFAAAAITLPIGLTGWMPDPDANAFLWVPWLLAASIGPLFFVVSAQAPLMQSWYARTGGDPYPLYAASNLGSFAGLLAYPLIVEPLVPIMTQRALWSAGYVVLALLTAYCALSVHATRSTAPRERSGVERPKPREIAIWVLLAAVPSGLILSTSLHLTTDIVAVPLLWVVPLGLYLLSFSIAFASDRRIAGLFIRIAPITLLITATAIAGEMADYGLVIAAFVILNFFALCVAIHSALFDRRPDPQHLTLFYLAMSVGGVVGGIFCAIAAPLLFDWTYENLILLTLAAALVAGRPIFAAADISQVRRWGPLRPDLAIAIIVALASLAPLISGSKLAGLTATYFIGAISLMAVGRRWLFAWCVAALLMSAGGWAKLQMSAEPDRMTRSYFGIYSIREDQKAGTRQLVHGTTVHGVQNRGTLERERAATSYYAEPSGVGMAMLASERMFGDRARIAVVGLGAGTLACYAKPGQAWTFYEIDPAVATIARDPRQFTFLQRCLPDVPIVIGDARLMLERAPPRGADVLVVDAFSSDSVPMHLLTREAFALYGRHLRQDGLLLVHISNRYLDLRPVIAAAARSGGWHARMRIYVPDEGARAAGHSGSLWVAMSPSRDRLDQLADGNSQAWQPLQSRPDLPAWTDDHSSLMPLIHWGL